MSYHETVAEHRRLAILKHLELVSGYTANASILTDVVNGVGVTSTRAQVEADLTWLEEAGLVTLNRAGDFIVVTATARGVDVAHGRSSVEGVKRPRPGV